MGWGSWKYVDLTALEWPNVEKAAPVGVGKDTPAYPSESTRGARAIFSPSYASAYRAPPPAFFSSVPFYLPRLNARQQAIRTASNSLGYHRGTSKKGFSEDLRVMTEGLTFAQEGITWSRERVCR